MDPEAKRGTSETPDDPADCEHLKHFVEHYLTTRGFHVTSRNARLVVSAIAACPGDALDWPTLEQCVDGALARELLHAAA